ncbi:paraquat-inducible membrane protein A [Raoultella terrigena]|uniref:Paraquat-inducible membrane protein A n=1 Tax=Raoultella terrigena TaxID=577 RepID=A0A4U9DGX2_RAOTE|nr:paraquat-inducible membrane protein A [Raoultella terrigena]
MNIYPAIGAVMFALVVVMTMFSAMTFDPRCCGTVNQIQAMRKYRQAWKIIAEKQKCKR